MKQVFEMDFFGRRLAVEVGEIAKQADASVLVRYNDTVVLSTAVGAREPKEGVDFFPLTVNYEERQYAAGKIPGSFNRREGRPSSHAILCARLIDRPIRPMFPEGFVNEVQLVNYVMSFDPDCDPALAAMLGSSLALGISPIPFDGPIAGVKVGRVDGKFIINPSKEEFAKSDLNLTVAGNYKAVNMVEAGAAELSEEVMLDAIMFGHEAIKKLIDFQKEVISAVGQEKWVVNLLHLDEDLVNEITPVYKDRLVKAVSIFDKLERQHAIEEIEKEAHDAYDSKEYADQKTHDKVLKEVDTICEKFVRDEVRRLITEDKVRPDGRKIDEIRPLDAQVDLLPRAHGSAMFTRGQTQVISTCTLGALSDAQILDDLDVQPDKTWMHHYNFPPFSVGEMGRMGTPGRREIGHGALGERALSYVIPSLEEFPYTIRCVADVVESNGSSSQASICASCMALMSAGVPIKAPVSGIAMGLISSDPDHLDDAHPYTVLTDIQGLEDHLGDMDFKCAGTSKGITALQMDIKIKGITKEVLAQALKQAHKARAEILDVMLKAIPEPRKELSQYALKMKKFNIEVDKIREVIGSQGKVINSIIDECEGKVKIDINDDGRVIIYSVEKDMIEKAYSMIQSIVKVPEVGEIYEGKVVRIESYGAFIRLYGDTDGMCHISKLDWKKVDKVEDVIKLGDTVKVIITNIDEKGRIDLSRRDLLPKPEGYKEENPHPRKSFDNKKPSFKGNKKPSKKD
ncbi:MAG: polyribonucleotide nucleotidyltransferase [Bacilli bacterium]|nr:polyribonucleotide nucleotidyltransferase [Bacilli bacterium]